MIKSLPPSTVSGLVEAPDSHGALSLNKQYGYVHARFQMGVQTLADYLIYLDRSPEAANAMVLALEDACSYQRRDGSFFLQIPPALSGITVTADDKVSGTAFFLAAAGASVISTKEAPWFSRSNEASAYRNRLSYLTPCLRKATNYLLSKRDVLAQGDADAANRQLFDALALMLLGRYTGNTSAISAGRSFLVAALDAQDPRGCFREMGGCDSSYNAVSLHSAILLYALLPASEPLLDPLWDALIASAQWQASRIASTGEILTDGNTRVGPGGETFLGAQKAVAWSSTALSFYLMVTLTGDDAYRVLADQVVAFYR